MNKLVLQWQDWGVAPEVQVPGACVDFGHTLHSFLQGPTDLALVHFQWEGCCFDDGKVHLEV